ncbi:MAG: bacteriophage abortive infection AbiH family protein [bacterium]|nr:bacteriophage abortive infection AbiH family protein [bacterium]
MKRKRLILVGNGLDLSLGLKTGYQDFALWFFKNEMYNLLIKGDEGYEKVELRGLSIERRSGDNFDEFKSKLRDLKTDVKMQFSLESIQDVGMMSYGLVFNISQDFIRRLLYCSEWADVERSYYNSVISIVNKDSEDSFKSEQKKHEEMKSLNREFEYVREKLLEYLSEQNDQVARQLDSKSWFNPLFSKVLTGQSHQGDTLDFVINFNYTRTTELILKYQETGNWVGKIDIHGRLEIEGGNPPIFGYGDDVDSTYRSLEDLNHTEYFRYIKSHYYSRNRNYDELLHFLDSSIGVSPFSSPASKEKGKEFEVHIIGHSCGISDRTLLKTIFEHDNCAAIYNYHWREKEEEARQDHFEKDINVSRHFDDKIKKRARFKPFDFSLKY